MAFVLAVALTLCVGCASALHAPAEATPAAPTSAQAGNTTVVAVAAAPAKCTTTLPDFLGITGLFKAVGQGVCSLRNALGMRFPGLESKPPVLALTDPANLDPNAPPSVQAAAKIKAEEDGAAQKVKAIRYLAGIGCGGCYPDVQNALLAALDDCTEVVRYEAAKALRDAAGNPCHFCRADSCCGPEVMRKLYKIALETDGQGCFVEPSARVRRVARLAMNACGSSVSPPTTPEEGPTEALPEPAEAPPEGPTTATRNSDESRLTTQSALAILGTRLPVDTGATWESSQPDAIAARVNGEPIWLQEILPRVDQQLARLNVAGTAGEQQQIRAALLGTQLQRAVDDRLLRQEAERCLSAVDFAQLIQQTGVGGPSRPGATAASVSKLTSLDRDRCLAEEWARRRADLRQEWSREELLAHYRTRLDEYRSPARVRWEQLTVRYDRDASREAATETMAFIRAQLLGEHSEVTANVNPSQVNTSVIDFTSCDALPPGPVGKMLATLAVGQISPVLADAQGVHLVRVLERTEPRCPTLDEVAERVRRDLCNERSRLALQAHLRELRATAVVEITPGTSPADVLPSSRMMIAAGEAVPQVLPAATPVSPVSSLPVADPSNAGQNLKEAVRPQNIAVPNEWTR